MPSLPPPGSVTVCEINRELIVADRLSDARASETYGKLIGTVFSPIPFQIETPSNDSADEDSKSKDASSDVHSSLGPLSKWTLAVQSIVNDPYKLFFWTKSVYLPPKIVRQAVSWHRHKPVLAFISGPNQVSVWDFEDSDRREPCVLTSESQRSIQAIDWRPNSGRVLAVACSGGVCIWSASYPGNTASLRSGVASFLGTPARGSAVRWALVDFLQCSDHEVVTSICWSSNGTYLVTGSLENPAFSIWDVAQGSGTRIRRGLGGISMLKWAPSGDYFFSGKTDGTFYLWETNSWTSETWSSTGGSVTGAAWEPEGRSILISFADSSSLGSIHFTSRPPSLDAHLLPVELPELTSVANRLDMIAWDGSGERLAVSFSSGDEMYAGLIAVYDVRRNPLIAASLIGFIRGPGEKPKPLALAFHDKMKHGPLLSVCWSSGYCCTYPLLFRSNLLP